MRITTSHIIGLIENNRSIRPNFGLFGSLVLLILMSISMSQAMAGLNPPTIVEPIETGLAGSPSTIMVTNVTPNFPFSAGGVEYYFSFNSGTTVGSSFYCPGSALNLANARFLGRRATTSDGISSFVGSVPASFEGVTIELQAIDTSTCEVTQRVSLTFGPPIQEFDLFLNPLVPAQAGKVNTFNTNFATPGGFIKYLWGFNPGSANGSSVCAGFVSDIVDFRDLGNTHADNFGNALSTFYVPLAASGLTIYLQVVDLTTCNKSNLLSTTF